MAGESEKCVEASTRWRRREREVLASALAGQEATAQRAKQLEPAPSSTVGARETVSAAVPPPPTPAQPSAPPQGKKVDPCPVCLEGFDAPGEGGVRTTCRRCGNNFHQACLSECARKEQQIKWEQKPWMLPSQIESGSCPCCRSNRGHDRSKRWARK
mmetsp:Transcript_40413/g.81491  ORF Transcript_40413/g.81491 Transcript_40413/m.81491 type:complete len:157 (-) Transcript_40413:72-542(-)